MNIVSFLFCILAIYFAGKIGELMILYWKEKSIMRIEKEHSERSNKLFEDAVKRKEAVYYLRQCKTKEAVETVFECLGIDSFKEKQEILLLTMRIEKELGGIPPERLEPEEEYNFTLQVFLEENK